MSSKRKTLKTKKCGKIKNRIKTHKRKDKYHNTRKHYRKKGYSKQKGGIGATNLASHNLINAVRLVPHTITNVYNGLVGNPASVSFLPWTGHYS